MKNNILVKRLSAIETIASINELCVDKTSTLTKNEMVVKEFYTLDQIFNGINSNYEKLSTFQLMTEAILFCSTATIKKDYNGKIQLEGSDAEKSLIRFLMKIGVDIE